MIKSRSKILSNNKDFPKLMINTTANVIILAVGVDCGNIKGVVIESKDSHYKIGYESNSWNPSTFYDFTGEVTLSNI